MILDDIKQSILSACQSAFSWQPEILNLINPEPQFGDFALACHPFSRALKLSPQQIAEKLSAQIKSKAIVKAEAMSGYLNLTVASAALAEEVLTKIASEGGRFGCKDSKAKERIVVEYSSPNTNKPLHLGHIRNNALGMSVANLLAAQGAEVIKVSIINDRGIHITKSMVACQKWGEGKIPKDAGKKGDHFVGKFYVMFEKKFEREWQEHIANHLEIKNLSDDDKAKKRQEFFGQSKIGSEAQEMLRQWEQGDKAVHKLWEKMNKWVYEGFAVTYKELGSEFDKDYFESETYLLGNKLVDEGVKRGVFYQEADGSVWVDLADVGLDKKVLRRRDGTSVYITQDMGLAVERQKEWKAGGTVYVVGHEQEYHFKVLFAVLKKLSYEWADKLHHLSYGLVFLPEGKMKSREGKVVDADEIIAEVKALAANEIKKRAPEIDEAELRSRSHAIGLGALKFFLLKVTPTQAIHYNPAEAIAFEGHTGPYVQYAHARIASILKEVGKLPSPFKGEGRARPAPRNQFGAGFDAGVRVGWERFKEPEEKILLLQLWRYPQVLSEAAEQYNPALLCEYLYQLAQSFNGFYHQHQVLKAADEETRQARVLLVSAVQTVLRNGLSILCIAAPEKM